MKLIDLKNKLILGLFYLLIGGFMGQTVQAKSNSDWHSMNDEKNLIKFAFPSKPIEMKFPIPFSSFHSEGDIEIYTLPMTKGTLILSIIDHDTINKKVFEEEAFKQFIDQYLVKHLYQNPQNFHNHQTYKSKLSRYNDNQYQLSYKFTYSDTKKTQQLQGISILNNFTLYSLIYIAPKQDYDYSILENFYMNFHLNNG